MSRQIKNWSSQVALVIRIPLWRNPAELQEEEQYRRYFKEALELEILEQGYPADKAVLYEILELLVETVTSRKKFLRICGEEKPKEVVKSRLMKLDGKEADF